jgi:hypothetical protein
MLPLFNSGAIARHMIANRAAGCTAYPRIADIRAASTLAAQHHKRDNRCNKQ